MTTGRINQVTVLNARLKKAVRAAGVRLTPSPRARVSHRPIKVVTPPTDSARNRPLEQRDRRLCRSRVPSPPISHASETLPQSNRLGSDPSVETTGERPHLMRGLPERGVSPIRWLQTELAHRQSDPHPSALTAESVKGALQSESKAPAGKPAKEPGQFPFPSGHILQGRRINRSDPGRPAVPKRGLAGKVARRPGGVYAGLPAVPAPKRFASSHTPVGHRPSRQQGSQRQKG